MDKLQALFEKYSKNKKFVVLIVLFHLAFVSALLWFFQNRERTIFADSLFVIAIVFLTFYWKCFAKMKKKEYEER